MCAEGRKQYFKKMFGKDSPIDGKALHEQENALAKAHDIRKFEIELYWKRATYFWAFQASIFVGVVATLGLINPPQFLTFIFSFLGLATSVAWHYVNKGSKFWQENWELHIDLLEKEVTGNLYKNVLSYENNKGDAYSVSRINLTMSLIFAAVWVFLFLLFALPEKWLGCLNKLLLGISCLNEIFFIIVIILLILLALFFHFCPKGWKTNFSHSEEKTVDIYENKKKKVVIRTRRIEEDNSSNNDSK